MVDDLKGLIWLQDTFADFYGKHQCICILCFWLNQADKLLQEDQQDKYVNSEMYM